MAKLVSIIGVTHSPTLPYQIANLSPSGPSTPWERGLVTVRRAFAEMSKQLTASNPEVLIVIGCDHLNQWFMNNMPAFLIGKASRAYGPFPSERAGACVPEYEASIDQQLAKDLIAGGFKHRVDFSYSDEFLIDHSFTVPLALLRPEADLQIVPIFTNVIAPPIPPALRFYEVGLALRDIIDSLPLDKRIAVVSSGHLSIEIGGPRMRLNDKSPRAGDPDFDATVMSLLANAEPDALCTYATPQRMMQAGNLTSGFLNFALLAGLAQGTRPVQAEEISQNPFLRWAGEVA